MKKARKQQKRYKNGMNTAQKQHENCIKKRENYMKKIMKAA